jgi:hypothetical protein
MSNNLVYQNLDGSFIIVPEENNIHFKDLKLASQLSTGFGSFVEAIEKNRTLDKIDELAPNISKIKKGFSTLGLAIDYVPNLESTYNALPPSQRYDYIAQEIAAIDSFAQAGFTGIGVGVGGGAGFVAGTLAGPGPGNVTGAVIGGTAGGVYYNHFYTKGDVFGYSPQHVVRSVSHFALTYDSQYGLTDQLSHSFKILDPKARQNFQNEFNIWVKTQEEQAAVARRSAEILADIDAQGDALLRDAMVNISAGSNEKTARNFMVVRPENLDQLADRFDVSREALLNANQNLVRDGLITSNGSAIVPRDKFMFEFFQ